MHATIDIANPVDGYRSEEGRNGTRSRNRGGDFRHSTRVAPGPWFGDDPLVFAARDRVSLLCLILIAAFAAGGMLL